MDTKTTLLAGAGVAGIAAVWGHIKSLFNYFVSFFVVTLTFEGVAADFIPLYLRKNGKATSFGGQHKYNYRTITLKSGRTSARFVRETSAGLFWLNKIPVWVSSSGGGGPKGLSHADGLKMSFIRGTLKLPKLFESLNHALAEEKRSSDRGYFIRCTGTAGTHVSTNHSEEIRGEGGGGSDYFEPVGWSIEEQGLAEGFYADTEATAKLSQDINTWIHSEEWFVKHQLPWRRGVLLSGPPGTGKSSLVKQICRRFGLRVISFDCSSLTNKEFDNCWNDYVTDRVPCIALFEDFDAVFNGREKITDCNSVTFDTILNAISGVTPSQGVLTIVTTNEIAKLDYALLRPGRLDVHIELGMATKEQKVALIEHFLSDLPAEKEALLKELEQSPEMTSAALQERCTRAALEALTKLL